MKSKFKVGDRLQAIEFDKEQYGIEYVTISSINEETGVYHWVTDWNGGVIHSGYFFNEAKPYMTVDEYKKSVDSFIMGAEWVEEKIDSITDKDIIIGSDIKSVEEYLDGSVYQKTFKDGFIFGAKWMKEQIKNKL